MGGRLDGKVAIVTGAASGLGLASALRFGSYGAEVAFADLAAQAPRERYSPTREEGMVRADG